MKATRIVEFGVGNGERAQRMIAVAAAGCSPAQVFYTGIDLFELRPASESQLTLKTAHRKLRATGAAIQLVPGDPCSALYRKANSLAGCDLLIIHANQDPGSLQRAWFYMPRMLHDQSLVLMEEELGDDPAASVYREMTPADVHARARERSSLRPAA